MNCKNNKKEWTKQRNFFFIVHILSSLKQWGGADFFFFFWLGGTIHQKVVFSQTEMFTLPLSNASREWKTSSAASSKRATPKWSARSSLSSSSSIQVRLMQESYYLSFESFTCARKTHRLSSRDLSYLRIHSKGLKEAVVIQVNKQKFSQVVKATLSQDQQSLVTLLA